MAERERYIEKVKRWRLRFPVFGDPRIPANWENQLVTVWEEDDATLSDPDAEKVQDALERMFGKGLRNNIAEVSWGDSGGTLYDDGVFVGWSYCGGFISVLAEISTGIIQGGRDVDNKSIMPKEE